MAMTGARIYTPGGHMWVVDQDSDDVSRRLAAAGAADVDTVEFSCNGTPLVLDRDECEIVSPAACPIRFVREKPCDA